VANAVDDYTTIQATNVNGIGKASGGECVLEGPNTNAVEDNIHAPPRTKQRDYKQKRQ
jgi:hypothetical protein